MDREVGCWEISRCTKAWHSDATTVGGPNVLDMDCKMVCGFKGCPLLLLSQIMLVDGLVKAGKIDEMKSFFDIMVKKLRLDVAAYEFIFKGLSDAGK